MSSFASFYKVTKNSNSFLEKNINLACNKFRRSVDNGENHRKCCSGK